MLVFTYKAIIICLERREEGSLTEIMGHKLIKIGVGNLQRP